MADCLPLLRKKDPSIVLKLLLRATCLEGSSPFGPNIKSHWKRLYSERHVELGSPLKRVRMAATATEFDWQRHGVYELLPPMPRDCADPKAHTYTALSMNGNTKDFEAGETVNGSWIVMTNWSLKSALMSSGGRNPTTRVCYKHFGDEAQVRELVPHMVLPEEKDASAEIEQDSEYSDEDDEAGPPSTPAKMTPHKPLKRQRGKVPDPGPGASPANGGTVARAAGVADNSLEDLATPCKAGGIPGAAKPPPKVGGWVSEAIKSSTMVS